MCIAFWRQRFVGFDKKSLNKARRSMIVLALENTHRSLTLYPICEHPVRRSRFSLQQHCISRQSKRQVAGKEGDTAKCRDAKGVVGVAQENFSVMCPPGAVWGLILFPQVYSRLILEPFFYCFHVNARKRSFGHLYISLQLAVLQQWNGDSSRLTVALLRCVLTCY